MRLKEITLALLIAVAERGSCAQTRLELLAPLVEASARRLAIADKVALAKIRSHTAIEDSHRENVVIASAVEEGRAKGLAEASISRFFGAQIEASKLVQYSLVARWNRSGVLPEEEAVSLTDVIRPSLDQIQTGIIDQLAATASIRSRATCASDIAKAIGEYNSKHRKDFDTLHAIALDRSLAAACETQ
jgi:chorismate mutase